MGRRGSETRQRTHQIAVRLLPDEYHRLHRLAEQGSCSPADVLRRSLSDQPAPTASTKPSEAETLDPWIDRGIIRAVRLLNDHGGPLGLVTYESCDGSPGHCYERPTVRFHGGIGVGWHALAICQQWGLRVTQLSRLWQINDGEACGPYWELIFHPSVAEGITTPPMAEWVTTERTAGHA